MVDSIDIRATIGQREVSRAQVLKWESRRGDAVLAEFAARLGALGAGEVLPDLTIGQLSGAALDQRRSALTSLRSHSCSAAGPTTSAAARCCSRGIAFSAAGAVVFLSAGPVWQLMAARLLSGASADNYAGAGTAAVIETAPASCRHRTAAVATAANVGGWQSSPLMARCGQKVVSAG
ncbi:hypothetical protein ACFXNW_06345 [Nocardia sp. NPDC059180]|uniref:hypothetical protein n=1 Tax=Nocardia sp. NPDC059180 TaxID=3346761 RepID=UPI0036A78CA0